MHLKGSYSGRSFSIGSDGSVQFSKTMYFEPDYPYETQLDLYMCSGFPHIGDPWKFDNDEIHSDITVNFAKQLVCNGVNNEGKLVDEASDLAAQNMEVWVVNATYKIQDGINIKPGSDPYEPTPVSPDPFPSGSATPSATYIPDNYSIAGAPWEKYPEISVDYTEYDSSIKEAYKTLEHSVENSRDAYEWFCSAEPSTRWAIESNFGNWKLPVQNPVGEAYDFKETSYIASESIHWYSRKLDKEHINTYAFANDRKIETLLGHKCEPHSLKFNPVKISRKIYNWVLDSSKINELVEDYVEKHPDATQDQLSSLYTQYYNNPNVQIPYYEYELSIDYNPDRMDTMVC